MRGAVLMITLAASTTVGQLGCKPMNYSSETDVASVLTVYGTGDWDQGDVAIWNGSGLQFLERSDQRFKPHHYVAVSRSGRLAAWITFDYSERDASQLSIWTLQGDSKPIFESKRVNDIRFEALLWIGERLFVSITDTDMILAWDQKTGALYEPRDPHDSGLFADAVFSAGYAGSEVVSASTRRLIRMIHASEAMIIAAAVKRKAAERRIPLSRTEVDWLTIVLLGQLRTASLPTPLYTGLMEPMSVDTITVSGRQHIAVGSGDNIRLYREGEEGAYEQIQLPEGAVLFGVRIAANGEYVLATLGKRQPGPEDFEEGSIVPMGAEPSQVPALWQYKISTGTWQILRERFGRSIYLVPNS